MTWPLPIFLAVASMLILGGDANKAFLADGASSAGVYADGAAASAAAVPAAPAAPAAPGAPIITPMITLSRSKGRVLADEQDDHQVATSASALASTSTAYTSQTKAACESANHQDKLEAMSYWERVEICTPCVSLPQCGFCLSTLRCSWGDALGPLGDDLCHGDKKSWIFNDHSLFSSSSSFSSDAGANADAALATTVAAKPAGGCPVAPPCEQESVCTTCVVQEECVWCANSTEGGGSCRDVSDVFSDAAICRAAVFDAPCPASFVSESRVVGDVVVAPDEVFGGGHLNVNRGTVEINDTAAVVSSGGTTTLRIGDTEDKDTKGGSFMINSGAGTSPNRGTGGRVRFLGGNSSTDGSLGDGGSVQFRAATMSC